MSQDRSALPRGGARSGGGLFGGPPGMGLGIPVSKPKNFRDTSLRLVRYLQPHWFRLLIVFVSAVLSTVFSIVSPYIMGKITTQLFTVTMLRLKGIQGANIDFPYIWKIIVILAILYVFSSVFSYIQQYIMAGVAQGTVYEIRRQVNEKLTKLPLRFYDSRSNGEIMSRFINDFDNISNTLQQSLTQLITSVITFVGVIVMMLYISPLLALVVILTLPLSFVATQMIAKRSQKYFMGQQRSLGELNAHVEEMYTGHKIIKAFGREAGSILHFNEINERLYESGWKSQYISGIIMPLMNFIGNLGYVLVSVIGGVFVTQGVLALGNVQAFIQYARQFTQPITQLASIANVIQSTMASAERVFELLDEEEEVPEDVDAQVIEHAVGEVQFEHVKFGYKSDAPLMEDMNISVKQGQTIAIVGPTGAGKTTLVNLLMRFYEVDGGRILIDGIDARHLTRANLHAMFGMVLQDTWLFHGTIRDNIGYGRENATEQEIMEAAKAAHADHFIRTLPDGYETILNEEASNISQGQKQLLTIARAVLSDPTILILDEATSSVDTRTEVYIQKAMSALMVGRTSFVIAHRLSTIREAELILVMNHGKVIETGNHEQLLASRGFYFDLYNSQFTEGEEEIAIV